jgi:hypothetical protein
MGLRPLGRREPCSRSFQLLMLEYPFPSMKDILGAIVRLIKCNSRMTYNPYL